MSKITSIVLTSLVLLVFFVVGIGFGGFYQIKKCENAKTSGAVASWVSSNLVKILTSKTISTIYADGEVVKIDGRNITISAKGEGATYKIADGADINIITTSVPLDSKTKTAPATQTKGNFSNIKVGQKVNILLKVLDDGKVAGQAVIIFTSATK